MYSEDLLAPFTVWLGHSKAAGTIRKYEKVLRGFLKQVRDPFYVDAAFLTAWRTRIDVTKAGVPASANYINLQLAAVKAFYDFMVFKGYMRTNPAIGLRRKRVAKRLPRPLSREHIRLLLDGIVERKDTGWQQDIALIQLCYGSGLRRSEAACLTLDNVETAGVVRVIGKGDKERNTCIVTPAYKAIRDLVLDRYADDQTQVMKATLELSHWPHLSDEEAAEFKLDSLFFDLKHRRRGEQLPIFFTQTGHPVRDLTEPGHYVWGRFKKCCKASGLHATPHMLRHSFGTHALEEGADILTISEAMGHSSVDTTRTYVEVGTKQLNKLKKAIEGAGAVQ